MNKPVSERSKQRRRILQAAASVPVVMTLPSGAALAASSVMCDQNSFDRFRMEQGSTKTFADKPDGWMRVELQKYLILKEGSATADRVPGFTYDRKWYEVSPDSEVATEIFPENYTIGHEHGPTIVENESYYGLVNSLGAGEGDLVFSKVENINPIAGASCWNSLTGTRIEDLKNNVIS